MIAILLALLSSCAAQSTKVTYSTGHSYATGIMFVLAGITLALFGHRLVKPAAFLAGAFLFSGITYVILTRVEPSGGYNNRDSVLLFSCLAVGLIGGLLGFFCYKLGLSIIGALGGFAFAIFILSWKDDMFSTSTGSWLFVLAFSLAGSILIQFFEKPILITLTAMTGSYVLFLGLDVFIQAGFTRTCKYILSGGGIDDFSDISGVRGSKSLYGMLIGMLVFFILAAVFQYKAEVRLPRKTNYAYNTGRNIQNPSTHKQVANPV
jgi:hypothetical protein